MTARRRLGRNRRAFDSTLRTLRDLGRVDPIDAALVTATRTLADMADRADSDERLPKTGELVVNPQSAARVMATYLDALERMTGGGGGAPGDDPLTQLLADLGAAPVGDPPG